MSRIRNKNESHKKCKHIKIKGMTLGYPGFIQTTMSRRQKNKYSKWKLWMWNSHKNGSIIALHIARTSHCLIRGLLYSSIQLTWLYVFFFCFSVCFHFFCYRTQWSKRMKKQKNHTKQQAYSKERVKWVDKEF